jgi:hypothetical protein
MWSLGMIVARSCGLTSVSSTLAALTHKKEAAWRQRLREWCWDPSDKPGSHRQGVAVAACFASLVGWVLSAWSGEEHRLVLVLDATTLKANFVVLAISLVYRGCAIPVAWTVTPAGSKGSWKAKWLALLIPLSGGIPPDWQVVVLADRGLYADWLFRAIRKRGWHPFLRINCGGKYRQLRSSQWQNLQELAAHPGSQWSGPVVCFKHHPVRASLLVYWEAPHAEAWLILTSLLPAQAEAAWYGMRAWMECGFRHTKRGGWQWQSTRMQDPARANRLWLAMAVATLWAVRVGGEADENLPASSLPDLPATHIARRLAKSRTRPRLRSCFRRGIDTILVALIRQDPLPLGRFIPQPWPH